MLTMVKKKKISAADQPPHFQEKPPKSLGVSLASLQESTRVNRDTPSLEVVTLHLLAESRKVT